MRTLDQFLHPLFLDHDCVVVPGLGGFVCNRQPARYDEVRQELTPPYRSVLFNERLVHHDGVLAQAVARAEDITLDAAVALIESEVEAAKAEVFAGKTVSIARVGRLYKGNNERVQFIADEEMERMLQSFGLRKIPLRPLVAEAPQTQRPTEPKIVPLPAASSGVPIGRIAAAIAVPLIGGLGMFMADNWESQDARLSAINVPTAVTTYEPRFEGEAVPTWDDMDALVEANATEEAVVDQPVVEATRPTTDEIGVPASLDENPGLYMLVAGAFSVEENAATLAAELVSSGFDAEVFFQDGGLHIVTYATHFDERSARAHLAELRMQSVSENAWLKPWKVIR